MLGLGKALAAASVFALLTLAACGGDNADRTPTSTPSASPTTTITLAASTPEGAPEVLVAVIATVEPTPEPPLDDGLGHTWQWGAWRNPDESAWLAPTPVPTPVAARAQVAAAVVPATSGDVLGKIRAAFGENGLRALRVAYCESGFSSSAIGGAGERGIFQIHPVHPEWPNAHDPDVNIAAAMRISDRGRTFAAWDGQNPGRGERWASGGDCAAGKPGYQGA